MSATVGVPMPHVEIKNLVATSIALKGLRGLLFIFGSSLGAYLLLLHQLLPYSFHAASLLALIIAQSFFFSMVEESSTTTAVVPPGHPTVLHGTDSQCFKNRIGPIGLTDRAQK